MVNAQVMDEAAFADLAGRYGRELHIHCYRLLGSFDEAEDLLQEVYLRAWRSRLSFEGRSSTRVWLYRIATNACLDRLRHRARRPELSAPYGPLELADIPWLQPYPDLLLDEIAAPAEDEPGAAAVGRETVELVLVAALQALPPRQRAVLIVRDLLGWSASETASLVNTTTTAVNSALQRAHSTLRALLPGRSEWSRPVDLSTADREMLEQYIAAHERGDTDTVLTLVREDLHVSMPPDPQTWRSRIAYADYAFGSEPPGRWRVRPTRANGQPAVAFYLRRWGDDTTYRATALQVLRIEAGLITEIVAFQYPHLFDAFGLPPTAGCA